MSEYESLRDLLNNCIDDVSELVCESAEIKHEVYELSSCSYVESINNDSLEKILLKYFEEYHNIMTNNPEKAL